MKRKLIDKTVYKSTDEILADHITDLLYKLTTTKSPRYITVCGTGPASKEEEEETLKKIQLLKASLEIKDFNTEDNLPPDIDLTGETDTYTAYCIVSELIKSNSDNNAYRDCLDDIKIG